MTQLLEKVFSAAAQLPELEQNILARWIMDEIAAEKKWDILFSESEDFLSALAEEALSEHQQGKTKILPVDEL